MVLQNYDVPKLKVGDNISVTNPVNNEIHYGRILRKEGPFTNFGERSPYFFYTIQFNPGQE
jgi:hypothetical protein